AWDWAGAVDVARALVAEGRSVIPVDPRTKRPAIKKWEPFQTRPPTDDELEAWFGGGNPKRHGVGVVTGRISGLVVIDGDGGRKNGHRRQGPRELKRLGVPATRWRRTPHGGVHALFEHPG